MKPTSVVRWTMPALAAVLGCGGGEEGTVQSADAEHTAILIVDRSGPDLRWSWSQNNGWRFSLSQDDGSVLWYGENIRQAQSNQDPPGQGQQDQQDESPSENPFGAIAGDAPEGALMFSGTIASASAFSGGAGTATSFSGGSGASGAFSGGSGAAAAFSGSMAGGVPLACDASIFCEFLAMSCDMAAAELDEGAAAAAECEAGVNECRQQVNTVQVPAGYAEIICAMIDMLTCLLDTGDLATLGEDAMSSPAALSCIEPFVNATGMEEPDFFGGAP